MASADLSLRPAGEGADVRQIFSGQATTSRTRVLSGTVVHVLAVAVLLLAVRLIPDRIYKAVLPERLPIDLVYLPDPGPGGGGGGGDRSPEPPPPAELKGADQTSVPATPPEPTPVEPAKVPDLTEPQLNLPLESLAASSQVNIGDLLGKDPGTRGRGPGDGPGVGPGRGPGAGPGDNGGSGGGPYQVGNGVLPPKLRRKVEPQYSADAMRAKIHGVVLLAAVVQRDGRVTNIRVLRSLDQTFGLDMKAIEAARKWEFEPGTRFGEPVPVLVNIELEFNLR